MLTADGSYTYSVLNGAAETVASTHIDSFTVTAADGTTKDVSFTIHGSNDAPIVQDGVHSKIANLSADGGQLVFSGGYFFGDPDFTVSDPDGPQLGSQSPQSIMPTVYGNISLLAPLPGRQSRYRVARPCFCQPVISFVLMVTPTFRLSS